MTELLENGWTKLAINQISAPFQGWHSNDLEDSHMNTHSKMGPMTFNFTIQIKSPLSNHETATCLLWLLHRLHELTS